MNKRGQFYLIAALVVIGLLAGFGTIYNSVSSQNYNERAEKIVQEIQYETSQIIDNALFKDLPKTELISNLDKTLDAFSSSYPDVEFAFVYGNESEIKGNNSYNKYYSILNNQREIKQVPITIYLNNSIIQLSPNEKYEFPIKQQNIYLIVKINKNGEVYAKTNFKN